SELPPTAQSHCQALPFFASSPRSRRSQDRLLAYIGALTASTVPGSHAVARSSLQHARSPSLPHDVIRRHVPLELNALRAQRQLPVQPAVSVRPPSQAPCARSSAQHARWPSPPHGSI